jgi:hypothetical protein
MAESVTLSGQPYDMERERFIVEFVPNMGEDFDYGDHNQNFPSVDREQGGRLVVRTATYSSRIPHFNRLFEVMCEIGEAMEPPVEFEDTYPDVVHYGGRHYKGTYGLEASIPADVSVPESVDRRVSAEYTL